VVEYVCRPEGAPEPLCRMPALETEVRSSERSGKTKTRLLNLSEVAYSLNRPESHLLAFLALHNNATAGADRHGTFFEGHISPRLLQAPAGRNASCMRDRHPHSAPRFPSARVGGSEPWL
jgi:hypothetical protein